jgi:hypothetical protein
MVSTTTGTDTEHHCLGCRRLIRSAEALATGYGSGCRAKIRRAARTTDLSAWTESQVEDARQAIEDGAVVPSTRPGVFHIVSSDGTEVHLTAERGCNCTSGLQTRPPRPCWHRCAVAVVLAASTSATAPQAHRSGVTESMPIALVPAAPDDDIWARLEAVGALDLVAAF